MIVFSKRINKFYNRIEKRFITNLNDRSENIQSEAITRLTGNSEATNNLAAWDVHIVELEVNPLAEFIGKTLVDLQWREKYGVNIGYIKRG